MEVVIQLKKTPLVLQIFDIVAFMEQTMTIYVKFMVEFTLLRYHGFYALYRSR